MAQTIWTGQYRFFGSSAESAAPFFKGKGHKSWFYNYLSGIIALSPLVHVFMCDAAKDSAITRHE